MNVRLCLGGTVRSERCAVNFLARFTMMLTSASDRQERTPLLHVSDAADCPIRQERTDNHVFSRPRLAA